MRARVLPPAPSSEPAPNLRPGERKAESSGRSEGTSQPRPGGSPSPDTGRGGTSLAERALNHEPKAHVQPLAEKGEMIKPGSTWREVSRGTQVKCREECTGVSSKGPVFAKMSN